MHEIIAIDQSTDNPIRVLHTKSFRFRYANSRAADSQRSNDKGQDYLTICYNSKYLGFVVADGVSQSFFGDIAAKILGDQLLSFLMECGEHFLEEKLPFQEKLEEKLEDLVSLAMPLVKDFPLPEHVTGILQSVLEQKRQMGSQTTFIAGYIDLVKRDLALAWMGDERVRLWNDLQETSKEQLGLENFQTAERWSSSTGMIGTLHTRIIKDSHISRMVVYTDGLAILDEELQLNPLTHKQLEELIFQTSQMPQSDDTTFFELTWEKPDPWEKKLQNAPESLECQFDPKNQRIDLLWKPVENVKKYQVAQISSDGQKLVDTNSTGVSFKSLSLPKNNLRFAVRALLKSNENTAWSKVLEVGDFDGISNWIIPPKPIMRAVPQAFVQSIPLFTGISQKSDAQVNQLVFSTDTKNSFFKKTSENSFFNGVIPDKRKKTRRSLIASFIILTVVFFLAISVFLKYYETKSKLDHPPVEYQKLTTEHFFISKICNDVGLNKHLVIIGKYESPFELSATELEYQSIHYPPLSQQLTPFFINVCNFVRTR